MGESISASEREKKHDRGKGHERERNSMDRDTPGQRENGKNMQEREDTSEET